MAWLCRQGVAQQDREVSKGEIGIKGGEGINCCQQVQYTLLEKCWRILLTDDAIAKIYVT